MPPKSQQETLEQQAERLREEKRAVLEQLVGEFRVMLSYRYSQSDLLNRAGLKDVGGVCQAITLDWMRRKLFNATHPDAKKSKKEFGSIGKRKRVELTKKHNVLQKTMTGEMTPYRMLDEKLEEMRSAKCSIFSCFRKPVIDRKGKGADKDAKAKFGSLDKEFSELKQFNVNLDLPEMKRQLSTGVTQPAIERFQTGYEGAIAFRRRSMEQTAVGIIVSMEAPKFGHSIGIIVRQDWVYSFDPNVGEFRTATESVSEAVRLLAKLTVLFYSKHFDIHQISFKSINYIDGAGSAEYLKAKSHQMQRRSMELEGLAGQM